MCASAARLDIERGCVLVFAWVEIEGAAEHRGQSDHFRWPLAAGVAALKQHASILDRHSDTGPDEAWIPHHVGTVSPSTSSWWASVHSLHPEVDRYLTCDLREQTLAAGRRVPLSRQHENVHVLREPLDQAVTLGQAGTALEHERARVAFVQRAQHLCHPIVLLYKQRRQSKTLGRCRDGSLEVGRIVAQAAHANKSSTRRARARVRGSRAAGTRSLSCS